MPDYDETFFTKSIHDIEKVALTGGANVTSESYRATHYIIDMLRHYRAAAKDLLASRYSDGEVCAVSLHNFESACQDVADNAAAWLAEQ